MSQQDAMKALEEGKKITHRFFLPGEYVLIRDGKIFDESDRYQDSFWEARYGLAWQTGWSIVD